MGGGGRGVRPSGKPPRRVSRSAENFLDPKFTKPQIPKLQAPSPRMPLSSPSSATPAPPPPQWWVSADPPHPRDLKTNKRTSARRGTLSFGWYSPRGGLAQRTSSPPDCQRRSTRCHWLPWPCRTFLTGLHGMHARATLSSSCRATCRLSIQTTLSAVCRDSRQQRFPRDASI